MEDSSVVVKSKNINSKNLFKVINDFILEGIHSESVRWRDDMHRESFIEIVEEFLTELAMEAKITQFNAMCDLRNNSLDDLENGTVLITIKYKQKDCLNVSEINYKMVD